MNNLLSKDIVRDWDLKSLSSEKQAEAVEHIGRILYQAVLVRSLDILSDTDQVEFDDLLDQDTTTPEDALRFLQSKIPTFDLMVIEERRALKEDLLMTTV